MLNKLKSAHLSCHHGMKDFENQLMPLINANLNYDIIEIDFVYHHGQYISSHDYDMDNIQKGSNLSDWIDFIMMNDKILWIDLKDTELSIFLPQFSNLNVKILIEQLNACLLKWPNLHQHLLIGCQYHQIYETLCLYDYTIIRDLPKDIFYVLDILTSSLITQYTPELIYTEMSIDACQDKIIAIDKRFFNLENLVLFINQCLAEVIIIYTFELPTILNVNKHIIYQYDF